MKNINAYTEANEEFNKTNEDLINDGWTETTTQTQSLDSNAESAPIEAQTPVVESIEVPAEALVEAPAATEEVVITDTIGPNESAVQEVTSEEALVK